VFTFINLPDKVKARGFELTGNWNPGEDWALNASYTHARTTQTGSSDQLAGVPKDIAQGSIDYHPKSQPFGATLNANWVGSVVDNVSSGFGRQQHGHYVVVDLNGYVTFGPDDRHRISLRVENLFGADYATRVNRTFEDVTGDPYLLHYRGVPRTLHVAYSLTY
jgi:vitamin B12 transporter